MHSNPLPALSKTLIDTPVPFSWHQAVWSNLWHAHQNNTLAHAILISGLPGLGQLDLATHLAKSLLCTSPRTPQKDFLAYPYCNQCKSCHCFEANVHPNYHLIQAESSNIGIDPIRKCITHLQHTAQPDKASKKRYKIALIHPANTLQNAAGHALLKTLEEPPTDSLLILISHNAAALMPTIRSRCQTLRITVPTHETSRAWLQQQTHRDISTIDLALSLAGEAPLQALKFIEAGVLSHYDLLLVTFSELSTSQKNPSIVAEQWSKIPQDLLFDYLIHLIATLIQYKAGVSFQQPSVEQHNKILNTLAAVHSIPFLYQYLDALQSIRRDVSKQSLNLLLSLEILAYQWSQADIMCQASDDRQSQ